MSLPKAQTRWKNVDEAAEILGLGRVRVYQFVQDGRLPASRVGRRILINERDLKEFAKIPRHSGRPLDSRRG